MSKFFFVVNWFSSLILRVKYKFYYTIPLVINKGTNRKMFISYITRPFYDSSTKYMRSHQNVNESLCIAKELKKLFFEMHFYQYDKKIKKNESYDIVFGVEPNFLDVARRNPQAKLVYYATGAYYKHQNRMIKERTDQFNSKYGTDIPYRRLVQEHSSAELSHQILQIGTKNTIETYPEHLQSKICIINQSSYPFFNIDIDCKKKIYSKNDFLWFGSGGSILKGVDLLIDFFIKNEYLNLHVVGPVEEDVLAVFKNRLKKVKNIFFYGYLDISSSIFRGVAEKCCFIFFPSASEGGCPGSVLNAMKLGLIPITSKWASPPDIDRLGYMLQELEPESISNAVMWSQKLDNLKINSLIELNHQYIIKHYNLEGFSKQIYEYFNTLVANLNG